MVNKYVPHYIQNNSPIKNMGKKFAPNSSSIDNDEVNHIYDKMDDGASKYLIPENEVFVPQKYLTTPEVPNINSVVNIPEKNLDKYVLMVDMTVVSIDTKEEIEKKCNDLVFGRSSFLNEKNIDIDRLVVSKVVSIRAGIFLE